MQRKISVYLSSSPVLVGFLYFNAAGNRESGGFEYSRDWLAHARRFQLDPALPLREGRVFRSKVKDGSAFHGAIADTEPDGWGRRVIMRDHAKRRQRARRDNLPFDASPLTSIDFLLAVDDFSRIGALRFQDEHGVFQRCPEPTRRTAPPLLELAQIMQASRAVETQTESAADLEYLRGRGTSVGGMRPKCSVLDDEKVLSIAKFPSVQDLYAVTKGEVLALGIAGEAGLHVAQARLIDSDGVPVALIKRFDRTPNGGRIPYVSASTLLGVEDSRTPQTYTQIVDALRQHSADYASDAQELFGRIVLTILINNVDDHLHNHGFLHVEKDKWRLSPAFDVNPFPDKHPLLKTWISEDSGDEASVELLMDAAPYFGLNTLRAKEILGRVLHAVTRWRVLGKSLGMTSDELDAFEPAFENQQRGVADEIVRRA